MLWFFLLFSTGCWGLAEIFYKKGNVPNERYAHLKTTVFVGIFLGIYSLVIVLTQDVRIEYLPANIIRYLPVAACYIVSMVCSYYGVRYIEESISDPIENTSCAVVPVLCAVFLHQELSIKSIIAIIIIVIGILGVVIFDSDGKANRTRVYGKKLALIGIAMPFCYMIFDYLYHHSADNDKVILIFLDFHFGFSFYFLYVYFLFSHFWLHYQKRKNY